MVLLEKLKTGKRFRICIASLLIVTLAILVITINYSTEIKKLFARYAMPSPQSGTQQFKTSSLGRYNLSGFTLMIGSYVTSVSVDDPAVLRASNDDTPMITDLSGDARKKIYQSGGSWYLEWSIKAMDAQTGDFIWSNARILLMRAGFDWGNPQTGKSLLDNMFSEPNVNKQQLADDLSSGTTVGWINAIISVRIQDPDSPYGTHAYVKPGSLWSTPPATKYGNSTKAKQIYTDSSVTQAANWTPFTERILLNYFNIQWTIPQIIQIDKTPPAIYFRNSADTADFHNRNWDNTDITVRLKFTDSGSGYKDSRYVWSTSTSKPSTGWSSWMTSSNYTTARNTNGNWYLHVEARDKAGNTVYSYKGPYRIDKTAPGGSFSPNNSSWTNQNISVTFNPSDSGGSGVYRWRWRVSTNNGSSYGSWSSYINGDASSTIDLTTEGLIRIQAEVYDNAGNSQIVTSGTHYIDKTNPSHVSGSVTGYRYADSNNLWVRPGDIITVRTRARDTISGIKRHYIRMSGSGVDARTYHDWDGSSNNLASWSPFDDFTHVEVVSVSRTYNSGSDREVTWQVKPKTHGYDYDVQYYYYDYAWNGIGYGSLGVTIRVDGAGPTVTFSPGSQSWTKNNATVTITASDSGSGVKTLYYRISSDNGATWGSWSSVSGNSTTVTFSSTGQYKIQAYAVDNVDNTGSTVTSGTYQVDKTAPIAPNIILSTENWTNGNVTVTISGGSDAHSGIARLEYRLNGGSWITYSSAFTISSEGITTIEARSVDNAGNTSSIASKQAGIDKTAPTPPAIIVNPSGWTNSSVTVTITPGTDNLSGISKTEYRLNGGSWTTYSSAITISTEGITTIEARTVDNAGNISSVVSKQAKIDKTAPTITANPSSRDWGNTDVSVTLNFNDSRSGLSVTQYAWSTSTTTPSTWNNYSGAVTQSSEGVWYLHAKAVDGAGNITTTYFGPYKIDKTLPTATFSPSSSTWTKSVTITIFPSDSGGSGVKQWRYAVSNDGGTTYGAWSSYLTGNTTITLSVSAVYKIKAEITDNAGNTATVYSGTYSIDSGIPSITATPVSRDWGNTDVSIAPVYSDTGGSGFKYRQYTWSTTTVKPTAWTNYTGGSLTQTSEGVWYLHLQVEDNAGNYAYAYFGPYKVDKTLPAITASPTTRDWSNTSVTVTLAYSDGGSGLTMRQYAWSTSTAAPSTWNNYTSPVTQSGEGVWYLHVRTADVAGNVYTGYFGPYKVDKTAPMVSASPSSREWGDTPVTVTLAFSDSSGSGLKDKLYTWSNTTETPADDKWNVYSAPVTQETPGTWYLHVKATDNAGNQTVIYFGPYIIDRLQYIQVIPSSVTIVKTETLPLTVKAVYHLKTEDITTQAQYTSSNASIVTVDGQGVITGKAVGQAVITATYKGKQAQCTVTVQEPEKTVTGTVTITKNPTYVFTKWNKTEDGQPSNMDITVSWSNINLLILRVDKTVLRSEPVTVTRAESQHKINRYTNPETYSWGTLINSNLTVNSPGNGSYHAVYEYDRAGKPNSPFTFTGYYVHEGQERSFSVTVDIPVNGISTTLLKPSNVDDLTSGFLHAFTNSSGNNMWKYSGVWPASGVLTLGGSTGELEWPVPGNTVISSYFGRRIHPIDGIVRTHYGIDIPAPKGTDIVSPNDGRVIYSGYDDNFGNMLVVRSGIYDFIFGHCNNIVATPGQDVAKGQVVAKVGNTGQSTGPHLDFRVTVGPYTQGNYIDPLTVVKPE